MKIAVFTDLHANYPALKAFLQHIEGDEYDKIIHLGDAIAIGPNPRECMETLVDIANIHFVMGNHDDWYANGLPQPCPEWMTDEELVHQKWTHSQLGDELRTEVRSWPWIILWQIQGIKLAFLHYALDTGGMSFKRLTRSPSAESYDVLFDLDADYVFFGHNHVRSMFRGRAWYINPGSSGCQVKAEFPYLHLTIENGSIDVQYRQVNYDDRILFEDFENRRVPAREFIYQAFFGSRFSPV